MAWNGAEGTFNRATIQLLEDARLRATEALRRARERLQGEETQRLETRCSATLRHLMEGRGIGSFEELAKLIRKKGGRPYSAEHILTEVAPLPNETDELDLVFFFCVSMTLELSQEELREFIWAYFYRVPWEVAEAKAEANQ